MGRDRAVNLWVGLFALAGIVAMLFLALRAANATDVSPRAVYYVNARFDNIGGLKKRAPVRSAGVTIGRVTDIAFDPQTFQAVVRFSVNAKYPFPKDSSAQILTSGLLGDQYVMLNPGGDTANLEDGDTLKITQGAVVLENLIGQFLYNKAAEGGDKAAAGGAEKPAGDRADKPASSAPGKGGGEKKK